MRFKIVLQTGTSRKSTLPASYLYELSGWIYKILALADPLYSNWLHSEGYLNGRSKSFKFFTFSRLNICHDLNKDGHIELNTQETDFCISFLPSEANDAFIRGVFLNQDLMLGRREAYSYFRVVRIEAMPEFTSALSGSFKTLSPIFVALKEENNNKKFLRPTDERYGHSLVKNLCEKYSTLTGKPYPIPEFDFSILNKPIRNTVDIKSETPNHYRLIAWDYSFTLKAPAELIEIGYKTGFGQQNSMGLGCVEMVHG